MPSLPSLPSLSIIVIIAHHCHQCWSVQINAEGRTMSFASLLIVFVSDLVMMLFAVWFGWISMNNIDINQIPLAPSNSKVTWWSLIWSTTILLVCLRFSSMQFLHILVSNKKKRYNVIVLQMYFFRFEICKKLGQGTYGKVQLGINKETGQRVSSHFSVAVAT